MPRKSTRNAQGGGTIRKRSDGRWEARYTVGRDPGTGKQIQKSVYGATQAEVRKKLQQATTAIDSGMYIEPSKMTLSQWLDIWLAEYMGDKKYLTVKGYKAQCNTHIKPGLGAIKISALTPHEIQKFYNDLQRNGKLVRKKGETGKIIETCEPLSPKSVRNVHGILTKALTVAFGLDYIKSNPAAKVTLPRVDKKEIEPLTDEHVSSLLQIIEEDEYGTVLKLILFTGLRESEATGLTWDCVDFTKGSILINKQLQKRPKADGGFTFAPLKNDKSRLLTPAPFVMSMLADRKRKQAEQRLKAGSAWEAWQTEKEHEKALVFTNALGSNLSPQTVYNHFKKLAQEVGAPDACVHDLRHTYAVLSIQNGDDIKTVQGNLGHATAAFTLDVYGHVSDPMKQASAARMQSYFENIKTCKG